MENRISFRIAVGVWLIAAFVLVQAYTSVLFTYVMTPVTSPLMNSFSDVINNPKINVLLKRGGTIQSFFKVTINIISRLEFKLINVTVARQSRIKDILIN